MRGEALQILSGVLSSVLYTVFSCTVPFMFLSAAAVILAIFSHIGQISTSTIPRGISMVKINTSEYANTLSAISTNVDDFGDIYTFNATAPLHQREGLRQLYIFGLYSHCAYVNTTAGICSSTTVGVSFRPYDDLTADMPLKHSTITDALLHGAIRESSSLGSHTKAAYWLILFGSAFALVAFVSGWNKTNTFFVISTSAAIAGSLLLLTGASIWTDVVRRIQSINNQTVGDDIPIGLHTSIGIGLYLLWASFATLFLSVVPYVISCCTWRG